MNRIYTEMEQAREKAFQSIWSSEIDAVFSDVAEYYDRANVYATLSLIATLRRRFLSTMAIKDQKRSAFHPSSSPSSPILRRTEPARFTTSAATASTS